MSTDKVCPECGGKGKYVSLMPTRRTKCPTCQGTGKVPVGDINVPDIPANHEAEEDSLKYFKAALLTLNDGYVQYIEGGCSDSEGIAKLLENMAVIFAERHALLTQQRTAAEQAGYVRGYKKGWADAETPTFHLAYGVLADKRIPRKDALAEFERRLALQPPQSGEKL